MVFPIGGLVTNMIDHTWEGDSANNRVIDLGDDYDLIFIWLEESKEHSDNHFALAYALRDCLGVFDADTSVVRHGSQASSFAAQRWQGKMTGGDVNKIKLGSIGAATGGANLTGMTYRLVGFKFASME